MIGSGATVTRCLMLLAVAAIAAIALTGCTSFATADADARATALVAHQQLLALKQKLRAKLEAEERYYRDSLKTLDRARGRADWTKIRLDMIDEAVAEYQALRGKAAHDPAVADVALALKLQRGADEWAKRMDAADGARRAQREEMTKALASLADLTTHYAAIERTLVELAAAEDTSTLATLKAFLEKAATQYRALESEAKKGP